MGVALTKHMDIQQLPTTLGLLVSSYGGNGPFEFIKVALHDENRDMYFLIYSVSECHIREQSFSGGRDALVSKNKITS